MRPVSRTQSLCLATGAGLLAAGAALAQPAPGPAQAQAPAQGSAKHRAEQHAPAHAQHAAPHHAGTKPPLHPVAPPAPAPAPTAAPAPPAPPNKGTATGLPLPRFASLRTDDVNFRAGPGTRYPIEWIYKRRDLPVEIEREFDVWRLVRDPDNHHGWVHTATLASRRTLLVTGTGNQVLRSGPRDNASPVAMLEPGVIGRLRGCEKEADWCQVQIKEYKGWMERDAFWGILPGEAVQ